MCKKAGRELDVKYRESLEQLQIDQRKLEDLQQMIENEDVKTADEKNTNKKKIRLLEEKLILLQSQLDDSIEKLRETQVTLDFGEEEKRKLLHKLSTLEEQHTTLIRKHSQQKIALTASQSKLDKQSKLCTALKKDYHSMTDEIREWADSQRSSSEALIKKIKDQEAEIKILKSQQLTLKAENTTLKKRQPSADKNQPPPSASLDNSLRKLDLQYQSTLEKGL
jgi:chromosome segregation ATPase